MGPSLHSKLESVAREQPDALAVEGSRNLTYRELFQRAAVLAQEVRESDSVGILSNRRWETYVGVLACFLARVPFTPLNPKFPAERLGQIAASSGLELILIDESTRSLAVPGGAEPIRTLEIAVSTASSELHDLPAATGAEGTREDTRTAYRMFTSGSTGAPKGVPISYSSLSHYVDGITKAIEFPSQARFSQFFDLSFDLAMHDIFVALATGGTIVPASDMNLMMPHSFVAKESIDVWFSVPMLALVAARGLGAATMPDGLQLALFCGEALPIDYVKQFRPLMRPAAPIWNLYGPTEATIAFTAKQVDQTDMAFDVAPLGKPFGANAIFVLAEDGVVQVPTNGVQGELLLEGPQVFDGYMPPQHTTFVQHDGRRLYRSGDRVELADGQLHHKGRLDDQVKLRGNRIELTEIEAAFRSQLRCPSAAAILAGEGADAEIHVAYTRDKPLRDLLPLATILPDYMIPARTLRLAALPVNANGKVDRKKLREIEWPAAD